MTELFTIPAVEPIDPTPLGLTMAGELVTRFGEHTEALGELWVALGALLFEHGGPTDDAPTITDDPDRACANVFMHSGELWTLSFAGGAVHVRDAKGVRDLHRLISEQGREVAALDLFTVGAATPCQGATGSALDPRATRRYRARIVELQAEVDDADANGDLARAERSRVELDALVEQLAGAYGLGGRPRPMGDPAERARKAVRYRVRDSIKRIRAAHAELGEHLDRAVNTGTFCSYTPDRAIDWEV